MPKVTDKHSDFEAENDADFLRSQDSGGYEVEEIDMVKKMLSAVAAKKRKAKQGKFLKYAEKELQSHATSALEDIHRTVKAVDEIYTVFLKNYATSEDRISKLWEQFNLEEERFIIFCRERDLRAQEIINVANQKQMAGLTKTHAACKTFEEVVERFSED